MRTALLPDDHRAPFPRLGVALLTTLCALAPTAHGARPMITDDARVVDPKACQVESWARKNRGSTEYWALPACNFTGNLELTLGGARTADDGNTQTSDVVLQGKTIFKTLQTNGWSTGLVAGTIRHPHVEAGSRDWYSYVPTSFSFRDDRFLLHTNLGWLREQATRQNRLTWGLGSETQLTERAWLIAETFGQDQGKPLYQAGFRYWLVPGHVQIDTTYGNRYGHGTEQRWFSIGLRLLSVPFLP